MVEQLFFVQKMSFEKKPERRFEREEASTKGKKNTDKEGLY